jgi:hypothetical protein
MLRTWFRRPLVDPAVIGARHDAVEFFVRSDETSGKLNESLRRLRDVPRLVERLRDVGAVTPKKDWRTLLDSIVALLQLAEARVMMLSARLTVLHTHADHVFCAGPARVRGPRGRGCRRAGAVPAHRCRRGRDAHQVRVRAHCGRDRL